MKIRHVSLWVLAMFLASGGCATLTETGQRYHEIVQDIREGRVYFAIVNLEAFLKDNPSSAYAPQAAFAVGEYYFDNGDNANALEALADYAQRYPKDKGVVFAKLIIYKIITGFKEGQLTDEEEAALIKEIRKELFAQPLFLIFYDKKTPRSYKSLFNKTYVVYDYVDKIKVFRDGKNFLELSP